MDGGMDGWADRWMDGWMGKLGMDWTSLLRALTLRPRDPATP